MTSWKSIATRWLASPGRWALFNSIEPATILAGADAARDARRWPEAARLYRAFLLSQPDAFGIWVQAGHAEKEAGNLTAAMSCYSTARRLNARDADLHLQIGHLLKLMGQFPEALQEYRRALELEPTMEDAANELRDIGFPMHANPPPETRSAFPEDHTTDNGEPLGQPATPVRFEVPPAALANPEDLAASIEDARQAERWLEVATLQRYRVRMESTQPKGWTDLADAFEKLGRQSDAEQCRLIAAELGCPGPASATNKID